MALSRFGVHFLRHESQLLSCQEVGDDSGRNNHSRIPYSLILYWSARRLIPSSLGGFLSMVRDFFNVRSNHLSLNLIQRRPHVTTIVRASSLLAWISSGKCSG